MNNFTSEKSVTILDLPIGNQAAVVNMVRRVGGLPFVISNPKNLENAKKVILVGVGAFDAGMRALKTGGWLEPLNEIVHNKHIPILGICLGMQLMCRKSEEGTTSGLGWFEADVVRITPPRGSKIKVPHMGWNTLEINKESAILTQSEVESRFYFVHSYHVICENEKNVIATTFHGSNITASIGKKNIFGVQFHPEKSHKYGMDLIDKFLNIT